MHNNNKKIPKFDMEEKHNLNFPLFCIIAPRLPNRLYWSAMAKSPDGGGVLLFGGYYYENRILELTGTPWKSWEWNTLNITLQDGRMRHNVIPLKSYNSLL